ncbi:MAG TPA: hypothetical protein PKC67_01730 [Kiritimatiellia bacterium]|nr:hypothetical protein [Kiritimatiellia bacterium]HMP33043.1 hypothetical protein [Kiritimatiellia bacterium]
MDNDLNNVLGTWTPRTPAASDIRAGVWQRIERSEPSGWRSNMELLLALLTRPALASGLVALAIMAGVAVGTVTSEAAQTRAYLASVAAYQMLP